MQAMWLDALHVLDSSFPTGAYVHSFGLEAYPLTMGGVSKSARRVSHSLPAGDTSETVTEGRTSRARYVLRLDVYELEEALRLRLEETLARLELVFLLHAYTGELVGLDERLHAMLLVREPREASALIGRNLLRSVTGLVEDDRLAAFTRDARHHHHPIVFGAVAAALEMPQELAAEAYAFGAMRGEVSAAQRLGWLGQRDAQRMLHALKRQVREAVVHAKRMALDDAGAFAPGWDIASMLHERAPARMFAS
jgi:urease accessory protein